MNAAWRKETKLLVHQLWLIGVLLLLAGSRLLFGYWEFGLYILWWWLGGVLGFLFVFLDRVVYAFYQEPEETLSIRMRELFAEGRFLAGLVAALRERKGQDRLIIRSVLFLALWLVLGFFTVTSVGLPFGRGFILGLGLHLSFDFLSDYFGRGRDIRLWFWQIKRELSNQEITGVVWGWVILFLLIALGL